MSSQTIAGCTLDLPVETLSAWRDHALPEAEMQRIAQHLSTCVACRTRLAEYDAVARALKTLAVPEPLGGYGRNPRLRAESGGRHPRIQLSVVPPSGLGAVAAALLIAVLAVAIFARLAPRAAHPTIISGTFSYVYVTLDNALSHPTSIVVGPDGNLWFTESGVQSGPDSATTSSTPAAIGRLTPNGTVTRFPLGAADASPTGIIIGPDGNLWFTESAANKIGRITPQGGITEFDLPKGSNPEGIAAGADGNLWYTAPGTDRIGRMALDGRLLGAYPTPTATSGPWGIARGADGNLWFTESAANKIGRITPQGGITEFDSPQYVSDVIVAGQEGNLWFTSRPSGKIGRITPQGRVTLFPAAGLRGTLEGMTTGPDGAIWFVLNAPAWPTVAPSIGRITPDGSIALAQSPERGVLKALAFGPDGRLWFTIDDSVKVGRFSPTD